VSDQTSDEELAEQLRGLAQQPEAEWDQMAAAVRDGYDRAVRARRSVIRRRRWLASAGGALALAAAFALYLRGHSGARTAGEPVGDTFHVFEDLEPGEMLEELSPDDIDRLAKAFSKGA
jgi:hypothetical protein